MPSSRPHPLSMEAACADGTPPPPLQIGDRVVWISDSGPEYGEVKWLGKLLDVGTEWMVGVEFVSLLEFFAILIEHLLSLLIIKKVFYY